MKDFYKCASNWKHKKYFILQYDTERIQKEQRKSTPNKL